MAVRTYPSQHLSDESKLGELAQSIIHAALARPREAREAFVIDACGPNADLYAEVIEALSWESRMGSFLKAPCELAPLHGSLEAGQLLGGRFEIVRQIGEGGMGLVFEALDRKRQTHVALKCAKPGFQRLLTPELERALTIRHPNICRVTEIHTAHTGSGEVDFLSMELLEGETLASLLHSHGRLPKRDVVRISVQVCSALSAAHGAGVVHGDLKPANIVLCRSEPDRWRVVITDFGLASSTQVASARGGTPGYMAPELVAGDVASPASDIYALGVVLHEMATGQRPANAELARVGRRQLCLSELPSHWARIISDCLQTDPKRRPKQAAQIFARLRFNHRRAGIVTATAVLCALLCSTPQVRAYTHDLIWPTRYVRLAIMPPAKADESVVPTGLLNDVADRLRHVRDGRRMIVTFRPSSFSTVRHTPNAQGGAALGSTHELRTRLLRATGENSLEFTLIELRTGRVLKVFTRSFVGHELEGISWDVASTVARAFGTRGMPQSERLLGAAEPPYLSATTKLWGSDAEQQQAMNLLQESARLDPASALPLTAMVQLKLYRYQLSHARGELFEARRLLAEAQTLDPESARVQVTAAKFAEISKDYPRALQHYARAEQLEPGNLDALYGKIRVHSTLSVPEDAERTYQRLMALYPACSEPRERFGYFNLQRGNYGIASNYFEAAIERAPGDLGPRQGEANALRLLGRYEEAERVLQMLLESGESKELLISLGILRTRQHRDAEAVDYFRRALVGDAGDFLTLTMLADVYRRLGRAESTATYRHAMESAIADLRRYPTAAWLRATVGYLAARLGDAPRALDETAQALWQSEPSDTSVVVMAIPTYLALDRMADAERLLAEAPPEVAADLLRHPDLSVLARHLAARRDKSG